MCGELRAMLRRTLTTNLQIMHVRNGFNGRANGLSVSKDVSKILCHLRINFSEIHCFLKRGRATCHVGSCE